MGQKRPAAQHHGGSSLAEQHPPLLYSCNATAVKVENGVADKTSKSDKYRHTSMLACCGKLSSTLSMSYSASKAISASTFSSRIFPFARISSP